MEKTLHGLPVNMYTKVGSLLLVTTKSKMTGP